MQHTAEWKQLNNIPDESLYIEFPIDFTGKKKSDRATAFTGLIMSAQFILAYIHTMNKINGRKPAKITYDDLIGFFGMSKETVCAGINLLIKLKIIERVRQAHYKIIVKYNKKDYVQIDSYLLKYEWEIDGKKKRLARSRLLTLAVLKRGVTNPKTGGEFVSSQERIGKAVNMPRTTAGDSIRELYSANAIKYEKRNGNDKQKRGCSLFTVNPKIIAVKHPYLDLKAFKSLFNAEQSADELHSKLMLDTEYRELIERINDNHVAIIGEIKRSVAEETETYKKLEAEKIQLGNELENYFKVHRINRSIFPFGYFRTDMDNNEAI